jgi:hypothetical protein
MSDHTRRVPPPPPPPPPEENQLNPPLPPLRQRRRDLTLFGTRTDETRRAVRLPEPPIDWPADLERADVEAAPTPSPPPPEDLGDVLRELTNASARPEPPPSRKVEPVEPPRPRAKPQDFAKKLNVPMICTQTDRAFVLVFREKRSVFGTRYQLETKLTDFGEGGEATPSLTVPIGSLDWSGITCPHCGARCRPIRCGSCTRLGCDGRITEVPSGIFFRCAPSCAVSGLVRNGLETITGTEGVAPKPTSSSRALICVPESPRTQNIPRLPKPE